MLYGGNFDHAGEIKSEVRMASPGGQLCRHGGP
jgi:hypothetical protein